MALSGFVIAGTHSGVGKTTLSLGIMAALKLRGLKIQPFKAGPDFIDPQYHFLAAGIKSRNLDSWMLSRNFLLKSFYRNLQNRDIAVVEGVMGFFDGYGAKSEGGSTAELAEWLNLPVILVVDAKGMAGSAGALVYGFENYDRSVNLAGVIFNRVGSEKHYQYLKEALEGRCRAEALGFIPIDEEIEIPERHLGLITTAENPLSPVFFRRLAKLVEGHIDLDRILEFGKLTKERGGDLPENTDSETLFEKKAIAVSSQPRPKIAVACDEAFCFYYEDNFDILRGLGAELVFFSPLRDPHLPGGIRGIYLGGGYPELFTQELAANKSIKKEIRDFAEKKGVIYGECGGFMYLTQGIFDFEGNFHEMVGIFPTRARMLKRLSSLGYFFVEVIEDNILSPAGGEIRGHQFHYSEIEAMPSGVSTTYLIRKKKGDKNVREEGFVFKNVLASYIHLHFGANIDFAKGLVKSCS